MSELYIGVMSGTSLDGVDISLCEINDSSCKELISQEFPFDLDLKEEILNMISSTTTLKKIGTLNTKLGLLFADSINTFLQTNKINTNKLTAIGLHGQTLWHSPDADNPFSMQLGCPNVVSANTNIKVISDFRSMDIANGGQGAPLTPAFHQFIFGSLKESVGVLNIGGMSNISILDSELKGWDIGIGNALLDYWVKKCNNTSYDKDGEYSASGTVNEELLASFLDDVYFKKLPPKSTGREYFNPLWLEIHLQQFEFIKNEDIQRTLLELSAKSIANDVFKTDVELLVVCGGGAKNKFLMQRLNELTSVSIKKSDELGVNSDFMESIAFAWLAFKRFHESEVNIKSVTGAKKNSILGGIYG